MPQLSQATTTRLYLPSTENDEDKAYVDVKSKLVLGDIAEINDAESDIDKAIALLTTLVKDWNFTDEAGAVLPITRDNINKLDVADFTFLSTWANEHLDMGNKGVSNEEKKTLSSPSIAAPETPPPII